MNERINELAIQCGGIWRGGYVDAPNGDSVYTDKKFVDGSELNVTQFAELIVKECATLMAEQKKYYADPGKYETMEYYARMEAKEDAFSDAEEIIKEHFRVKS